MLRNNAAIVYGILFLGLFSLPLNSVSAIESTSYLYTRSNPRVPKLGFEDGKVDVRKPLKVIIHGWLGSMLFTVYSDMRDAFLRKEDCNVVIFDWSKSNGEFKKSVLNARLVGNMLGDILSYIYDTFDHIHLIGHGIGAHLAGFAGKTIQSYTEGKSKIGRITAMDPTLPLFNGTSERLESTDATIVDVYHCDAYRFGFGDPIGTVDFYPNGGVAPLPGCNDAEQPLIKLLYGAIEEVFCSHAKCRTYYTDSINGKVMKATKCDSWKSFQEGKCKETEQTNFGEYVDRKANGSYYLRI